MIDNKIPNKTDSNLLSPNIDQLKLWNNNRLINPITKRKIKANGKIYCIFDKLYNEYMHTSNYYDKQNKENYKYIDRYIKYRNKKIDPLLMIEIPLDNYDENLLFKFPYKWNPYIGKRLDIDKNGILYFDPDTLIQYFYINRLSNLWIEDNNECYQGYYGDAMGRGYDFFIPGRGYHHDWYLFRLPIIDGYIYEDHCEQSVTMGPLLTNDEIIIIDKLAKKYKNNYFKRFNKQRPSLVKLKKLYDSAINPNPELDIPKNVIDLLEPEYITQLK